MYLGRYANTLLSPIMIRSMFTDPTSTAEGEPFIETLCVCTCVCVFARRVNVLVSVSGFHVFDTDAPQNPLSSCVW